MSTSSKTVEYMDCTFCRKGKIPVYQTDKGFFTDKAICNLCHSKPGGGPSKKSSFIDTLFSLFK